MEKIVVCGASYTRPIVQVVDENRSQWYFTMVATMLHKQLFSRRRHKRDSRLF